MIHDKLQIEHWKLFVQSREEGELGAFLYT